MKREDFVGLFQSERPGWHHIELRLLARDAEEALTDLAERGLVPHVRWVGGTPISKESLAKKLPGVTVKDLLIQAPLVAEVRDPDDRAIELIYLPEESTVVERPGLLGLEAESPEPGIVMDSYRRLGLKIEEGRLQVSSGQFLRFREGGRNDWVRMTIGGRAHGHLVDPDGHEIELTST